jgi:hypothetical protein
MHFFAFVVSSYTTSVQTINFDERLMMNVEPLNQNKFEDVHLIFNNRVGSLNAALDVLFF